MSFNENIAKINDEGYGSMIFRNISSVLSGELTYFSTIINRMESIIMNETYINFDAMAGLIFSVKIERNKPKTNMLKIVTSIVQFYRLAHISNDLLLWDTTMSKILLRLIISNCSGDEGCINKYKDALNTSPPLQRHDDLTVPSFKATIKKQEDTIEQLHFQVDETENKKHQVDFYKQRDEFEKEKAKLELIIEQKQKMIAEKDQAILDIREDYDSSIVTRGPDENTIRPRHTQEKFDDLMNEICELQRTIVYQMDTNSPDFEKNRNLIYKKLIGTLFEQGFWKLVKKPMNDRKLKNKQGLSMVLVGKQKLENGMTKEELDTLLGSYIENDLKIFIQKGAGGTFDYGKIEKLVKECSKQSIFFAAQLFLSKPNMGIIEPKKGDVLNPYMHEDATTEYEMIVESIKRPGLICTADNRVFIRASVETKIKQL